MDESPNHKDIDTMLHLRLLAHDDLDVKTEISERFLPILTRGLNSKFQSQADIHHITSASIDALMDYFKRPHNYDPNKGSLIGFLYTDAQWNLLNLLKKDKKFVELHQPISDLEIKTDERTVNPEKRILEGDSVLIQKMLSAIDNPVDEALLILMLEGVRETTAYAEALGIEDLPVAEQTLLVKQQKDRLKVKLRRKLERWRAIFLPPTWFENIRRWLKTSSRNIAPVAVILFAIAVLIGTNLYSVRKLKAANIASVAQSTPTAKNILPGRATINGISGRYVEKIFFASDRGSAANTQQTHIWMMNPDGTEQEQVTFGEGDESGARASPDGTKLVFQRSIPTKSPDEIGTVSIWMKDLFTGAEHPITADTDYPKGIYHSSTPTWSPDGNKIAFTRSSISDPNEIYKLWIVDISPEIGIPRQLTSEQGFHRGVPDWSPDGRHILFMHHLFLDRAVAIYSIDVETGKEEEIIPCEGDEYAPRYSPDGSKIMWMTYRHTNTSDIWPDVYVTDLSNPQNSLFRLSPNSGWGIAAWSPDGNRVGLTKVRGKLTKETFLKLKKSYEGQIPEYIIDELKPLIGREFPHPQAYEAALKELSGEVTSSWYRYKFPPGFFRCDDIWVANANSTNFIQLTSSEWIEGVLDWAIVFQPEADLSINAQASTLEAAPGDKITFAVTVTNNGPGTAKDVEVINEMSSAAKIISCSSTGNTIANNASNKRTIKFPTLAPNQVESILIVIRSNRKMNDETLNLVSTVSSSSIDAEIENNSATVTVFASKSPH